MKAGLLLGLLALSTVYDQIRKGIKVKKTKRHGLYSGQFSSRLNIEKISRALLTGLGFYLLW